MGLRKFGSVKYIVSRNQKELKNIVGIEMVNSCFLTVSGMEQSLVLSTF